MGWGWGIHPLPQDCGFQRNSEQNREATRPPNPGCTPALGPSSAAPQERCLAQDPGPSRGNQGAPASALRLAGPPADGAHSHRCHSRGRPRRPPAPFGVSRSKGLPRRTPDLPGWLRKEPELQRTLGSLGRKSRRPPGPVLEEGWKGRGRRGRKTSRENPAKSAEATSRPLGPDIRTGREPQHLPSPPACEAPPPPPQALPGLGSEGSGVREREVGSRGAPRRGSSPGPSPGRVPRGRRRLQPVARRAPGRHRRAASATSPGQGQRPRSPLLRGSGPSCPGPRAPRGLRLPLPARRSRAAVGGLTRRTW